MHPTPSPKYPSRCISSTRTEEILEVPNSTVWPGCNSITAKSLKVSSDDGAADDALATDEEECIGTYRRWRRAVCLMWARIPKRETKEGKREVQESKGFYNTSRRRNQPGRGHLFIGRTRRFGKHAVQQ
jgi:hypothetical protein